MSFKRITIPLSEKEQEVLRAAASRACRRPHDHARFIILKALGLVTDEDKYIPGPEEDDKDLPY
jgi:hypothetical protein